MEDNKLYKVLNYVTDKRKLLQDLVDGDNATVIDMARLKTLRDVEDYIKLTIGDTW